MNCEHSVDDATVGALERGGVMTTRSTGLVVVIGVGLGVDCGDGAIGAGIGGGDGASFEEIIS